MFGERCVQRHGLVAREHAATEEAVARGVGGELVVAVQISIANALLEAIHDVFRLTEFDDAPDFDARPECEFDTRDDPEEYVPADR